MSFTQDVAQTLPDADHVLLRILLCWLDPRTGAGGWFEVRHNVGAAKHFGDPSRVGCGQAAFGVLPQSLEMPNNIVVMSQWGPEHLNTLTVCGQHGPRHTRASGCTTWATRSNLSHTSGLILARFHTCIVP